jgi:peptidoglycan/xylan/chitin deacetylase (PgdA/CDA1 family)
MKVMSDPKITIFCRRSESHLGAEMSSNDESLRGQVGGPPEPAERPPKLLSFHSISEPQSEAEAGFYISGPSFRWTLWLLNRLGYIIAHPNDFLDNKLANKHVILTFDDAYDDLYSELLPVMNASGMAPIIFVVANAIGGTNVWDQRMGFRARTLLTLDQLREMQRHGATIGAHSLSHRALSSLCCSEIQQEVLGSKLRLEDMFGCAIEWFAYPYGQVDARVRAAVAQAGFQAAVTTEPGLNLRQDRLALRRTEINSKDRLLDIVGKLLTGRDIRRGLRKRIKKQLTAISRALNS